MRKTLRNPVTHFRYYSYSMSFHTYLFPLQNYFKHYCDYFNTVSLKLKFRRHAILPLLKYKLLRHTDTAKPTSKTFAIKCVTAYFHQNIFENTDIIKHTYVKESRGLPTFQLQFDERLPDDGNCVTGTPKKIS